MSLNLPEGFYSNYAPSKEWVGVGFEPTDFLQAAELNDLQRIFSYLLEKHTSKIFKEGQFSKKIQISQAFVDNEILVTIGAGEVYALGDWHSVPLTTIAITGIGKEIISLKFDLQTIDENDDPDLLDPAYGAEGYNLPAAKRFKYTKEYVLNDPKAVQICVFQDGQLVEEPSADNGIIDQIIALMAQRTRETSGSYLAIRPELKLKDPADIAAQNILLSVHNGIGYINGYRRENQQARLTLRRPLEGTDRLSEPETYLTGTSVYILDVPPILEMTRVQATLQSPSFNLTRGNTVNGADSIPSQYQPTYTIVSVSDVGHGTYTPGTDYTLGSGVIQWVPGGSQPSGGSTYSVVVQYTKNLTKGIRTQTAVTAEAKTVAAGAFTLAHSDLVRITKVEKADHSVVYEEGVDYSVATHSGVVTVLGGNIPNTTNLLVNYEYWTHTTEGDYVARDSFRDSSGNILYDLTPTKTPNNVTVNFKNNISFDTTGTHPVNNSVFYMDYVYALPRRDILVWDVSGIFSIVEGTPSLAPDLPAISSTHLPIVKLNLPAEARASDVVLEYYDNVTLLVTELRDMLRTLNDVLFNQAQFQLTQSVINQPTATDKIGVFADSCETRDLMDISDPDFALTHNPLNKSCELPRTLQQKSPTLSSSAATKMEQFWIPDFTEEVTISQPFSSSARVINKYGQINTRAKVVLSDPYNSRILPQALTLTTQYQSDFFYIQDMAHCRLLANVTPKSPLALKLGLSSLSTETPWYENKVKTATGWTDAIVDSQGNNPLATAVVTAESTTVQSNNWAQIIRNTKVVIAGNTPATGSLTVSGSVFGPNERFISCTFNGTKAALTATGGTVQETDPNYPGTVKADSQGRFTATVSIPSTVTAGLNKLEFFGLDPDDSTRIQSYTTANYVATPNMEYVNLTVKVAPNFNGWSWSWIAPPWAMCDTLGLPVTGTGGYSTWWLIAQWAWQSVGHMVAAGIAEAVNNGITLSVQDVEDAIAVLAAYTSMNTVVSGDVIHSVALAVNRSSTDIEKNARIIHEVSPYFSLLMFYFLPAYVVDPLAQTFSVFEDKRVSSIELYFNVAPSDSPVGVAIAEVTNGIPSSEYLTTKWIEAADITGSNNASVATKFSFDSPVYLEGGKDYAFVVITEDNAASIWTAVLGQKDTNGVLITKNPATGVCLESADTKSWNPLSGTDIKFKLNTCVFDDTETILTTGAQVFDDPVGQICFSVPFKEFGEGTKVTHQYSLDAGDTWSDMFPMVDTDLGGEFDTIHLRVKMKNTRTMCPVLIDNPSLDGFLYQSAGAYVHRLVTQPAQNSRYFSCYVDTEIPGNTAIAVKAKLDGGAYVSMTEQVADRINISDTKIQRHYYYDAGVGNLKQTWKVKIEMSTSSPHLSPSISKVRVIAR